jgi:hypothetical protein
MAMNLLKVIHVLEGLLQAEMHKNVERVHDAINKNQQLTVQELEEDLGIP